MEVQLIEAAEEIFAEVLDDRDDGGEDVEAVTFREAGLMTQNSGVVFRLPSGEEFQVTIVRSR